MYIENRCIHYTPSQKVAKRTLTTTRNIHAKQMSFYWLVVEAAFFIIQPYTCVCLYVYSCEVISREIDFFRVLSVYNFFFLFPLPRLSLSLSLTHKSFFFVFMRPPIQQKNKIMYTLGSVSFFCAATLFPPSVHSAHHHRRAPSWKWSAPNNLFHSIYIIFLFLSPDYEPKKRIHIFLFVYFQPFVVACVYI